MSHTNGKPGFTKNRHTLLAPEEIELDAWYTFNLNPAEQDLGEVVPNRRWSVVRTEIQLLIDLLKGSEIEGCLELSRMGRIHMHGWIKFTDITEFYMRIPKVLNRATLEIDTIANPETWEKYTRKQNHLLKGYDFEIKRNVNYVTQKEGFINALTEEVAADGHPAICDLFDKNSTVLNTTIKSKRGGFKRLSL